MPPRAGAIAGVLALAVTATLHAPDKQTPPVGVLVFTVMVVVGMLVLIVLV